MKVPEWLGKLGWKFSVPQITKDRAVLKPDQLLKVNVAMTKGKPYDAAVLAKQADHDIVFTVLQDDMPVGGMTYRLSTDTKQGLAGRGQGEEVCQGCEAARPPSSVRPGHGRPGKTYRHDLTIITAAGAPWSFRGGRLREISLP